MRRRRILIDTQIILWTLFHPKKLKKRELEILEDPLLDLFFSPISLFEISLKYSHGKLSIPCSPAKLPDALERSGFEAMPASVQVSASMHELPMEIHRDPFDRLLIWQAITEGCSFMSRDGKVPLYEKHGLKLV